MKVGAQHRDWVLYIETEGSTSARQRMLYHTGLCCGLLRAFGMLASTVFRRFTLANLGIGCFRESCNVPTCHQHRQEQQGTLQEHVRKHGESTKAKIRNPHCGSEVVRVIAWLLAALTSQAQPRALNRPIKEKGNRRKRETY